MAARFFLNCQLCCAASRIFCYEFCCCCIHEKKVEKKDLNILVLGLESCGKSYLLASLCGESTKDIVPTNGFSIKDLSFPHYTMHLKELGGSEKVRRYWDHYIDNTDGIIWVIDGNCIHDLKNEKLILQSMITHDELQCKPLLILISKIETELTNEKIAEELELKNLCARGSFMVESCTSVENVKTVLQRFAQTITFPEISVDDLS